MTVLVLLSIALGIAIGWLTHGRVVVPSAIENLIFAILLFAIGFGLGQDRSLWPRVKAIGWRMMAIPASVILGTLAGGLAAAALLHLTVRIVVATSAGMGWYSLAAIALNQAAGAKAGTLAFLANVFREVLSFVCIPWLAKFSEGTLAISIGGATTMDTTLPVLSRHIRADAAVLAFVNGVLVSLIVPVLIPLILGRL